MPSNFMAKGHEMAEQAQHECPHVVGSVEWAAWVRERASRIYIRVLVDLCWKSVALSTLPAEQQEVWIYGWAREQYTPIVLPEE